MLLNYSHTRKSISSLAEWNDLKKLINTLASAVMAKAITAFVQKTLALTNASSKFTAAAVEGSRILPTKKKDAEFQCRIDAGHYDSATKKLNVILQVNTQAKSQGLKDWVKKNSTHAKLGTETFDTAAEDQNAELVRVLGSLEAQGKAKVG